MKMVLIIVNDDDSNVLIQALTKEGFQVTKLSSTGGLLKTGNTTLLTGVENEKVDTVIKIVSENSSQRQQVVPSSMTVDMDTYFSFPVEVTVGGATIFVLDIDRYEKV